MTKKTIIVEMDEGLASLLQKAGQLKIIETEETFVEEAKIPPARMRMATDRISPDLRNAAADWMGGRVTDRRDEPEPEEPKKPKPKAGNDFASKFRKKP